MRVDSRARVWLSIAAWIGVASLPLLVVGLALEESARAWIESLSQSPNTLLLAACALLASDIVLPIPSSFICTVCGQSISWPLATMVCTLGMALGSVFGFSLARVWGRKLAVRFSSPADIALLDELAAKRGIWWLILLRPVPILAEASVLVCGVHHLPWLSFICACALSSSATAGTFTALGALSVQRHWSTAAWILSIALPLVMMAAIRPWLVRRTMQKRS